MNVSQSYSSDTATAAEPCEAEGSAWVSNHQAAYRQVPESWSMMQELQLNPSCSAVCSALIYQIRTGFVSGYRIPHHAEIFKEMSASLTAIFRSTQKLLVHQKGKTLKICSSPEQPCNQTS